MEIFPHSDQRERGTYKEFNVTPDKKSANITCPNCGQVMSLINHVIHYHGKVTPSVQCSRCSFHDYIELGSWNEIAGHYRFGD